MPAYVVAMMSIHDPLAYREYTDRTTSTVKKYGGKFLTRGEPVTTVEGEEYKDRMVILQLRTVGFSWPQRTSELAAEMSGRHMSVVGERIDIQRIRVLPIDPVANPAQTRQLAQVQLRGGCAGHR
jgi:hypothetical protein